MDGNKQAYIIAAVVVVIIIAAGAYYWFYIREATERIVVFQTDPVVSSLLKYHRQSDPISSAGLKERMKTSRVHKMWK